MQEAQAAPATCRPNGTAVLEFEGVSRTFTGFAAVDDLVLDLRRGEILTLLGPSGCGKTTTLRMAIGLERCTAGRVIYGGRAVDAPAEQLFVPPEQRSIGIVFQSYAIWPHMTVFENVAFPLRARRTGQAEVEERVGRALAMVGLADRAQRLGTQLSGGQQQRVAIARGIVFNPEVLLLDEPFSNLDAQLRAQMRSEIKLLQRELGISILFVTHDQTEALALSDRLAIMREGRVEQIGTPLDLYARPQTPFVRDFLGQWVRLDGTVERVEGGETLVRLPGGDQLVAADTRFPVGSSVAATIRPEHIAFDNADDGVAGGVAGTIRTLLFLGAYFEAYVAVAGRDPVLVNLPYDESWREGQAIRLGMPSRFVQLWPGDEAR